MCMSECVLILPFLCFTGLPNDYFSTLEVWKFSKVETQLRSSWHWSFSWEVWKLDLLWTLTMTWQMTDDVTNTPKTENAACLLDCPLLLEKYKQANKQKKSKKTKQVTVGLKHWKVAFAEFYFLKRSFGMSLFLNFQFLRPTVTFFLFVCLPACIFQVTKAQSSKQ